MAENENVNPKAQQELTVEQALNNLAIVTAEIKGTRQEHIVIQLSLQKIDAFIQNARIKEKEMAASELAKENSD